MILYHKRLEWSDDHMNAMAQVTVSKLLKAVGVSDVHILPFAAYQLGYDTVQASDLGEYLGEYLSTRISRLHLGCIPSASRLYLGYISADLDAAYRDHRRALDPPRQM